MRRPSINKIDLQRIDRMVSYFVENQELFERFSAQVRALFFNSKLLAPHVHSMKWRIKDAKNLKEKLCRKARESKLAGKPFDITEGNMFKRVTDLVGFRIIHLHTRQIEVINTIILNLLKEDRWILIEGPAARTWDDESRDYFKQIKIKTLNSKSLYTSVHYVFKANKEAKCACELQVRTVAEELWGEVDHRINYPQAAENLFCREQIKVLARVTSSCTRLVDSIFYAYDQTGPAAKRLR